ncbi:MAG: peptide chain release factor N(5)-glutamine methyltransferase [Myxococcales bacterium FL481]|nr:MAG: peptide chain release factor N(5)-glutamine methyltransferase [Myxococcales bacterium FL481]
MPTADRPSRPTSWTRRELLAWTTERFAQAGIESPSADAQHLLAHALGCSRIDLLLDSDRLVGDEPRARFRDFVRRRLTREPVAYIEGSRGFHALDLDLVVDHRVLVPRPETEHLVDWVLEQIGTTDARRPTDTTETSSRHEVLEHEIVLDDEPIDPTNLGETVVVLDPEPVPFDDESETMSAADAGLAARAHADQPAERAEDGAAPGWATSPPAAAAPLPGPSPAADTPAGPRAATHTSEERRAAVVLDVGTGSGAIALALKHARPRWQIVACDVSPDAIEVARANASRCKLDIELVRSDLLARVPVPDGGFSAIAANLPYIPQSELDQLQPEVARHEPRVALDGGPDGLSLVRRLLQQIRDRHALARHGWVVLEIGIDQATATEALLRDAGFVDVDVRRDLAGIPRVIAGRRP